MKGFRNSTKIKSGHRFPTSAGFSSSSGRVQTVRSYTRKLPKYAEGGSVDSSVIKRTEPMTQFDAEHGGKGPLRPGFAIGGPAMRGAISKVASRLPTKIAPPARVVAPPSSGGKMQIPKPVGRGSGSYAKGGKIRKVKSAMKGHAPPFGRKPLIGD